MLSFLAKKGSVMSQLTLVTGAGGFIGGQLVRDLLAKSVRVRAVDKKPVADWYFQSPDTETKGVVNGYHQSTRRDR